mmetsp:Transcript_39035/g.112752  ORF Transcript_39035/g.112752 Transcript_39035/m.112752 type:complete len:235 (-) Transcript_39035:413-1117(-)
MSDLGQCVVRRQIHLTLILQRDAGVRDHRLWVVAGDCRLDLRLACGDDAGVKVDLRSKAECVLHRLQEARAAEDIADPMVAEGRQAGAVEIGRHRLQARQYDETRLGDGALHEAQHCGRVGIRGGPFALVVRVDLEHLSAVVLVRRLRQKQFGVPFSIPGVQLLDATRLHGKPQDRDALAATLLLREAGQIRGVEMPGSAALLPRPLLRAGCRLLGELLHCRRLVCRNNNLHAC